MHKRINLIGTLILILGSCITLSGCLATGTGYRDRGDSHVETLHREKAPPPWAPAHGYRAKHQYRYYPSSHVYYDTGRGIYFYYGDGKWRISVSLPSHIHIDAGDYVSLEMNTDEPYRFHPDVVKRYPPGQLKNKHKKKGKDKW